MRIGETKRKIFTGEFRTNVAIEAIRGAKTVNQIGQEFCVHPTQVGLWKKELQEQAAYVKKWELAQNLTCLVDPTFGS